MSSAGPTVSETSDADQGVEVDKTAPGALSLVSAMSSNPVNAAYAKLGDVITLTVTASEPIVTPTVELTRAGTPIVTAAGASPGTHFTFTTPVTADTRTIGADDSRVAIAPTAATGATCV